MYYFIKGALTATAETDEAAARLTRHGWRRCTPVEHRAAWQARDAQRRLEGDIPPPGWGEVQDLDAMSYKKRVELGI